MNPDTQSCLHAYATYVLYISGEYNAMGDKEFTVMITLDCRSKLKRAVSQYVSG